MDRNTPARTFLRWYFATAIAAGLVFAALLWLQGEWSGRTALVYAVQLVFIIGAGLVVRVVLESQQRARAALAESEDRYRDLVENSTDLLCTHDMDGNILSVNNAAASICGYPAEMLVQRNIRDFLVEEYRGRFEDYLERIKRCGSASGLMKVKVRNGEDRIWEYNNTLRTKGVPVPIVRGLARDITERRNAELERVQLLRHAETARGEAEAANRAKDDFLATVSHELRTPLNSILGWAQMLISGKLDPERAGRALRAIERNAKIQAQLIEDLLDSSRIISGSLHLHRQPVDLNDVVRTGLEFIRPAADARKIRMITCLPGAPLTTHADPDRLQQVLWNLLSNAVKFTPKGGTVTVELSAEMDVARLVVSDTGEGIAPDFLPSVFERCSQGDSSATRRHGGLGLGLAIVRHLVEMHGGKVTADSAGKGKGASFAVHLPLRQITEGISPRGRPIIHGAAFTGSAALDGTRILVVDDDIATLEMLRTAFRQRGAEVQTRSSAHEALRTVHWFKPDLIVTDLAMPAESGYDLLQQLRESQSAIGEVHTLALTAMAGTEERERALESGFEAFVPKPVNLDELMSTVACIVHESLPGKSKEE